MKNNNLYTTPAVLGDVAIETGADILVGSVAETTDIKTTGQESGGYFDATDASSTFNQSWSD